MQVSTTKLVESIHRSSEQHWVGDGFPVRSVFGYHDLGRELSPFLLLDYAGPYTFGPNERRRGVGAHPHKGFETVSIIYSGEVAHRDSAGGGGTIGPGDVQWMTAGSGIVHEEFHSPGFTRTGGELEMIQLWVNLPARFKSVAPGYQSLLAGDIPKVEAPGICGTVRVIAGEYAGVRGPAHTFTPINVWGMALNPGCSLHVEFNEGDTTAVFVLGGTVKVNGASASVSDFVVLSRAGSQVLIESSSAATLLLLNGRPIDEPVAAYGPFVMNTEEEVRQAFAQFRSGQMGSIPTSSS